MSKNAALPLKITAIARKNVRLNHGRNFVVKCGGDSLV